MTDYVRLLNQKGILYLLVMLCTLAGCRKVGEGPDPSDLPKIPGWTFERVPLLLNFFPISLHFSSRMNGFASGQIQGDFTVIHTVDGGFTWTQQVSGLPSEQTTVFAVNDSLAYLSAKNGVLLHTTNGGRQWLPTLADSVGFFTYLHFSDADHGLAKALNISPASGMVSCSLIRTTDGGDHWSPAITNIALTDGSPITYIDGVYYAAGLGHQLFKSLDAGLTWLPIALPQSTDEEIDHIVFSDAAFGYLGLRRGTFLQTTDGGTNWEYVQAPFEIFSGMYFPDHNEGFNFGKWWEFQGDFPAEFPSGTLIYHTLDGGKTWEPAYKFRGMEFWRSFYPDAQTGYFIWTGSFYRMIKKLKFEN